MYKVCSVSSICPIQYNKKTFSGSHDPTPYISVIQLSIKDTAQLKKTVSVVPIDFVIYVLPLRKATYTFNKSPSHKVFIK